MRILMAFLVFLLVGFIGQIIYYYLNLPEKIAVHFNSVGEPDNWMSKNNFMILEGIILFLIVAEFTLLPHLIEKIPVSLINLPNKVYWLAESRRKQTFAKIQNYFEWLSIALLGLFIAINEFVFRANLNKQNLSNWAFLTLVIFLIFVGIWTLKLILSFKIPK